MIFDFIDLLVTKSELTKIVSKVGLHDRTDRGDL